jgi:hypothetical protein
MKVKRAGLPRPFNRWLQRWGNPWGFESPFGTIQILKGDLASRQIPFFLKIGRVAHLWLIGFFCVCRLSLKNAPNGSLMEVGDENGLFRP